MSSTEYLAPERIDRNSSISIQEELDEILDGGVLDLVIDMKDLKYISSAGLRVLAATQKRLMKDGKFALKNVPSDVKEILDMTGLSGIMPIL